MNKLDYYHERKRQKRLRPRRQKKLLMLYLKDVRWVEYDKSYDKAGVLKI